MKRTRFTEQQIVGGLNQAEARVPVKVLCGAPDFGSDVIQLEGKIRWAERLGLKRLKKLDAENATLKNMYADLAVENEAIKAVLN